MTETHIPLVDLAVDGEELAETLAAIEVVLRRGWFILGPEVRAFESELARWIGAPRAIGVGSGTDALILGLRALGVGDGDEVIVPEMTAFPTAAAVVEAGGTPVLVDIEPDRPLLDLEAALEAVTERTRAVVVVHLYGVAADADAFRAAFEPLGVAVVEDCAQALGARLPTGAPVGTAGRFAAFSFYPTKNLGALGDGGVVTTADEALADEIAAWRSHGERSRRYLHELPARNSRLDDVQAAVLRLRLRSLDGSVTHRRELSRAYDELLPAEVTYLPHGPLGAPHLAVIRHPARDDLAERLESLSIGVGVHYPAALSEQPALHGRARHGDAGNARRWARTCLSLPLHGKMTVGDVERVARAVGSWTLAP